MARLTDSKAHTRPGPIRRAVAAAVAGASLGLVAAGLVAMPVAMTGCEALSAERAATEHALLPAIAASAARAEAWATDGALAIKDPGERADALALIETWLSPIEARDTTGIVTTTADAWPGVRALAISGLAVRTERGEIAPGVDAVLLVELDELGAAIADVAGQDAESRE